MPKKLNEEIKNLISDKSIQKILLKYVIERIEKQKAIDKLLRPELEAFIGKFRCWFVVHVMPAKTVNDLKRATGILKKLILNEKNYINKIQKRAQKQIIDKIKAHEKQIETLQVNIGNKTIELKNIDNEIRMATKEISIMQIGKEQIDIRLLIADIRVQIAKLKAKKMSIIGKAHELREKIHIEKMNENPLNIKIEQMRKIIQEKLQETLELELESLRDKEKKLIEIKKSNERDLKRYKEKLDDLQSSRNAQKKDLTKYINNFMDAKKMDNYIEECKAKESNIKFIYEQIIFWLYPKNPKKTLKIKRASNAIIQQILSLP